MCRKYLEINVGIFILKRCRGLCLEVSVRAVPKNTKKAKKVRKATFFVLDLFIGTSYVDSSVGTAILLIFYSFSILN